MKINCPQCDQSYEFDDQLIPVAGYMAHCSRCAHVFFLARGGIQELHEIEAAGEPSLSKEPEIQPLTDENTDDILPPEPDDSPDSELETREFSGVALEGAENFEMPGEAFGLPDAETNEASTQDDGFEENATEATQAADFDEMLALSGTLGEPLSIDSDPYKAQTAPSIGGMLVKALLGFGAIGALGVAGLYFLLPDLYNDYLADVTGIRAGTHPRVIELQAEIPPLLNSDTATDRAKAFDLITEGLELESDDEVLLGLGGLLYTLESIRFETKGQLVRDEGDYASERIRKLSKLSIDERTPETLDEIKALKQRVFESSSEGTELDNKASRNTLLSSRHTGRALELNAKLSTALVARSLEATSNEKSVENADRYLKRLKSSLDITDLKDPAAVTDPWLAVALGYRNIYQADTLSAAENYFARAQELSPALIAAQTGLAEVAYRQANWDLAALRLDNILMSSPEHELAKYWRDILKLVIEPIVVAPVAPKVKGPGKETKVKKKKKKRNRKKKKRKKRTKRKPKSL